MSNIIPKNKSKVNTEEAEIILEENNEKDLENLKTKNEVYEYLTKVSKIPFLTENEEKNLLLEYKNNQNNEAGKKLIASHLRLVVKMAFKYKNYRANLMDVISEGNLGLMHALKKFEISKGVRFATYAIIWIRAFMQNFIVKSWSSLKNNSLQIKKALFGGVRDENFIMPSEVSFDTSNSDENNSSQEHYSFLGQEENKSNIIESFEEEEEEEKLKKIKLGMREVLNEREVFILESRTQEKSKTLEELSLQLGISKERVRQVEKNATEKLKKFVNK